MTWTKESARHNLSRQGIHTKKIEINGRKVVPMFDYGETRGSVWMLGEIEYGKAIRLTNGDYIFMSDVIISQMASDPKNPEDWIAEYAHQIPADEFRVESKVPSGDLTRAIKKVMYNE